MCQQRNELIQLFHRYLFQAEKQVISIPGKNLERRLILLFDARNLAVSLYRYENKYTICDLIMGKRKLFQELHKCPELNDLFEFIHSILFKPYAGNYIHPSGYSRHDGAGIPHTRQ